jgi:hypothetical protein
LRSADSATALSAGRASLYFPVEDDETPVIAFTHLRVVPVLRRVGRLSEVAV